MVSCPKEEKIGRTKARTCSSRELVESETHISTCPETGRDIKEGVSLLSSGLQSLEFGHGGAFDF